MAEGYVIGIIKSILREQASQNYVVDAIRKKYEVDITYNDGANGVRRIEPVAYGKSNAGNMVVRAYQVSGDSMTEPVGWKLFRLSDIMTWNPIKNSNFGKPPAFDSNMPYNTSGDRSMVEVYAIADFGDEGTQMAVAADKGSRVNTTNAEMQSVDNFNSTNTTQTTGPVMKDDDENGGQVSNEGGVEYDDVNNGPVMKGEE